MNSEIKLRIFSKKNRKVKVHLCLSYQLLTLRPLRKRSTKEVMVEDSLDQRQMRLQAVKASIKWEDFSEYSWNREFYFDCHRAAVADSVTRWDDFWDIPEIVNSILIVIGRRWWIWTPGEMIFLIIIHGIVNSILIFIGRRRIWRRRSWWRRWDKWTKYCEKNNK